MSYEDVAQPRQMNISKKQSLYFWSGIDARGNRASGTDRAESIPILKYRLLKENIICLTVNRQNQQFIKIRQWLNSKHTLFFLTQLAAMLKTGINLNKAIVILKTHQHEKYLTRLYEDIFRRLNKGRSLSQTLSNYPVLFDNVTLHIIKSGEIIGHTDKAIQQAGEHLEQKLQTSNELLTALLYPIILCLVTIGVLGVMVIVVIPQFETLYSNSNNQLPLLTTFVLSFSNFIKTNLLTLFLILLIICAFSRLFYKLVDFELVRYIPRLNRTLVQANTLRLCQTLNNLYRSGLPITDGLLLCKNLSSSHHYQRAVTDTVKKIHQGVELAQALNDTGYFEPLFIQLIKTGEQAASLSTMLEQCAHFYEKQLSDSLTRLKIILEPLLIVVLGIVIGIILIAMYLPVFNMGSSF